LISWLQLDEIAAVDRSVCHEDDALDSVGAFDHRRRQSRA
jgi:hypothetical protein